MDAGPQISPSKVVPHNERITAAEKHQRSASLCQYELYNGKDPVKLPVFRVGNKEQDIQ